MKLQELPDEGAYTPGGKSCAGCMAANIAINVMRVLGKKTIVSVPPSCMSVFGGTFPNINWDVPYFHMQFSNTASTITGISRALKAQGKKDIVVLGMAGDGGTADMGLQTLSGAAHRNEDILYICYNNQAYENTGIQASSVSPYGAWSTTTPTSEKSDGNEYMPKDMPRILIAHDANYVCTASTSHIQDFIRKIEKAKNMKGFRYIEKYNTIFHRITSWHHECTGARAVDISRSNNTHIPVIELINKIEPELKKIPAYGPHYQLLIEGRHFHLEYDENI